MEEKSSISMNKKRVIDSKIKILKINVFDGFVNIIFNIKPQNINNTLVQDLKLFLHKKNFSFFIPLEK